MYSNIPKNRRIIREVSDVEVINNYSDGAYVEVKSSRPGRFRIEIRNSADAIEYSTTISENMWCKTNRKYAQEYRCTVWEESTGKCIFDRRYNPEGKRVYIALDSKSMGDTMAWFPYAEEFRKKWGCKVICSTFWNRLFVDQYPEIEFVEPGTMVPNIYAQYRIGLYFNSEGKPNMDMHRSDPTKISLLKMSSDILGLEYKEVRPILKKGSVEKKKRVGIGFHSTAQAKYWNNPAGWQEVTDFLISKGYEVVILSKEENGYMGNFFPKGATKLREGSIESLMEYMQSCEFFIGISSGLSWLAWSLNIPTVLISGFTGEDLEPKDGVVRISNKSVCNDCWSRHKFDPGDWNWCPDQKGTQRQFECSRSISGKEVIGRIISAGLIKASASEEIVGALGLLEGRYEIIQNYSGTWNVSKEDIILIKKNGRNRHKRCYVLYCDEKYRDTVIVTAESIRQYSKIPIVVYMMNSDMKIEVEGTETIRWDCEVAEDESPRYSEHGTNFYINRSNKSIYSMLIQRPLVVKHALENIADVVAYVDGDSVATKNSDLIFEMFDKTSENPSFVEGIYDILFLGNRGGIYGDDYTNTLEHHACELFEVDQRVRKKYRQTGYFVAGTECVGFLEEWHKMCSHPAVMENSQLYAPFNEETIANVLLWKKGIFDGLPYIYVNIGDTSIEEVYSIGFSGKKNHVREWVAIPANESELMFFHGEKNPESMRRMIEEIKNR